jgi:cytochrome b subunit of formate dehydrogenase
VCGDCHGNHKILPSTDPASPVYKIHIPDTCGKCHAEIRRKFAGSIHGAALAKGNFEAPSCADCHGEHDIEAPASPTSAVYAGTIGKTTCPQCHASVRLARRFDLPEGMVKSYQASFHGLASKFGETNVANCASCHGAHDILPSSDPRSSIAPANLTKTCGKCHPKAGENFARTPIHLQVSVSDSPVLYWIRKFYLWIIAGTLLLLGFHNLLDFVRRYKDAIRALKPMAVFVRMTLQERIQHWLLLSTFFLLVLTGFALKYPDSVWALPFKVFPHGFDMRSWLHRAAAVVMILDALYHLVYLAATDRGRRFVKDVLPTWQDVKDLGFQIGYYLGFRPQAAQFGRFSYAEKVEYLALLWGTAVMVGTGLVLWFKTTFTRFLPGWGYTASEMIHFYEAVLAFSTIIIWHLYAVFSHTQMPPYNPAWLTGRMTEHDLEHYHYRVLVEIERERRLKEARKEREASESPARTQEKGPLQEHV